MAGGVFISYRRSDSAAFAGRIADFFKYNHKDVRVFFDVSGIAPGEDFTAVLRNRIEASEVILAIIGDDWLTAKDGAGNLRLENPEDFVRFELATALRLGARVIPVLLDAAQMPSADQLPDDLKPLSVCNAEFMRGAAFDRDAKHLGQFVEAFLKTSTKPDFVPMVEETKQTAGSPVFESLLSDFETFLGGPDDAFIICENAEARFVQFAKTPDGSVELDLPVIALHSKEQELAAYRFFTESYSDETFGDIDEVDTYNVELPQDASYLTHVTLEVFDRVYNEPATVPIKSEISSFSG